MMIRNKKDLQIAYIILRSYTTMVPLKGKEQAVQEKIRELKTEIRGYFRKKAQEVQRSIVKDYGIDGYVVLYQLPDFLKNAEDATEYFEEEERMVCCPSMYDCTGQAFTSWYKIFERRGRMWVYHSIAFDV